MVFDVLLLKTSKHTLFFDLLQVKGTADDMKGIRLGKEGDPVGDLQGQVLEMRGSLGKMTQSQREAEMDRRRKGARCEGGMTRKRKESHSKGKRTDWQIVGYAGVVLCKWEEVYTMPFPLVKWLQTVGL